QRLTGIPPRQRSQITELLGARFLAPISRQQAADSQACHRLIDARTSLAEGGYSLEIGAGRRGATGDHNVRIERIGTERPKERAEQRAEHPPCERRRQYDPPPR